jgi:hypothetical protein
MLVPREVHKIKRYFRAYDPNGSGYISAKDSKMAFRQWYISLIDRPALQIPVAEWLEGYKAEDQEEGMIQLFEKRLPWGEFLKRYVIFILSARLNTASQRPFIPRLDAVPQEDETEND